MDITGVYLNAYSFIWHQGAKDDSFFLWGCIFIGYVCYLVNCRKSTALRSGAVEAEGENADFNSHSYKATYHDLFDFSCPLWCDISVILTDVPLMSAFPLPVYWVLELWKCNQYCEVQSLPKFRLVWIVPGTQAWVRPAFFFFCDQMPYFFFSFPCKPYSQRLLVFYQKPSISLGMSPSLFCQSTGMKLLSTCRGLTAALGCTDIWKYFSGFRNSQFSLLHLTWNAVIANSSMPGTRTRVKGFFRFSQVNYKGWKNHCLISLPLPF